MDDQARKINFVHVTSSRDFLSKDAQERRWFVVDNETNHGGIVGHLPDERCAAAAAVAESDL